MASGQFVMFMYGMMKEPSAYLMETHELIINAFISISGAIVHYCLVNIMFWLACYSLAIMYKVVFPIHSKRTEGNMIFIHLTVSIIGKNTRTIMVKKVNFFTNWQLNHLFL